MEDVTNTGPGAEALELAALTARVAELERVVDALRQRGGAVTMRPVQRSGQAESGAAQSGTAESGAAASGAAAFRSAAPPPPPMPVPDGLPRIAAAAAMVDGVPLVSPLASRPVFPQFSSAPATPAKDAKSLENRLGAQVFNLVGILALVIAAAYGLKLAIEHGYLGPVARVLIGIAVGVGTVLWSERLRRKKMVAFSYSLKAVGSAVLYLTLWAGFQIYHLPELPAGVALGAMILVTAWNAFMAWSQDSELLAAYALAGGFLTPLLLSTGGDHEGFLFVYLGAIDLALVILLRYKPWRLLVPAAFVPTAFFFAGWYSRFFHSEGVQAWDGQSTETAAFVVMFTALFALVPMGGASAELPGDVIVPVLLPLAYGAFAGLGLLWVMQDSGLHSGLAWLMVGLAAVFLGLMRVQKAAVSRALHLAMAVVSLTVAIPLKASGHTLTTAWLVEGLVLLWASTRFGKEEERQASGVLWGLSAAGYALGLGSLVLHWFVGSVFGMEGFFNRDLGAACVAIVTLGGAVWLALEERKKGRAFGGLAVGGLVAIYGVAALLCLRELALTVGDGRHEGFANASFGTALVGLLVLAGVAYVSLRLKSTGTVGMEAMATAGLVGMGAVGVLFCLRELAWSWSDDEHYRAFANAPFATALVGLGVLAGVAYVAWRLRQRDGEGGSLAHMEMLAGATVIVFNLLTILTVEHEIGALWHKGDADLQRSLAISGFLMAYGAGLLAIGFVKRTAFIRWQALLLLLFTICKVFLYDISGLSAGYRVVSFMGLGAVLMGISYAYQKDWLGLKDPGADPGADMGLPAAAPDARPPAPPVPAPVGTDGAA